MGQTVAFYQTFSPLGVQTHRTYSRELLFYLYISVFIHTGRVPWDRLLFCTIHSVSRVFRHTGPVPGETYFIYIFLSLYTRDRLLFRTIHSVPRVFRHTGPVPKDRLLFYPAHTPLSLLVHTGFLLLCWLLNVPTQACWCISGTDLLRQLYLLPH